MGRVWTKEEIEFLKSHIGRTTLPAIATQLDRTLNAVEIKMKRLGLSNTKEQVGMVTAGDLAKLLKIDRNTVKGWIDRHGLKCKKKVTRNSRKFIFIDTEVFWDWAKENKEKINFHNLEKNSIPPEPKWVNDERLRNESQIKNYQLWTTKEEKILINLIDNGLTYREAGVKLNRTSYSVEKHYYRIQEKREYEF